MAIKQYDGVRDPGKIVFDKKPPIMLKPEYCTECGSLMIQGKIIRYDPKTGNPIHQKICSTNPCYHRPYEHEYVIVKRKRIGFLSIFSSDVLKCLRCGRPPYDCVEY